MTSPAEDKYRIWDTYWRDSRLHTLGAEIPEVEAVIEQHWTQVAIALPENARVLDVACGNGAAAVSVARAGYEIGKVFGIAAVDTAAIDPPAHVTRHAAFVRSIAFHAMTRMEELPFADNTFDAVISQFGMEYGDLAKASWEAARVLKPLGVISVLAMPASSFVLELAKSKVRQSQHVLTQTKLFDVALVVAQALHNIESTGDGRDTKPYLDRFNGEVERAMMRFANTDSDTVAAVVIALQKIITERRQIDINSQIAAINMLKKRVTDHVARTDAMLRAALGDAGVTGFKRRLTEAGIVVAESKPISVGTYGTVAWRIGGRKGG